MAFDFTSVPVPRIGAGQTRCDQSFVATRDRGWKRFETFHVKDVPSGKVYFFDLEDNTLWRVGNQRRQPKQVNEGSGVWDSCLGAIALLVAEETRSIETTAVRMATDLLYEDPALDLTAEEAERAAWALHRVNLLRPQHPNPFPPKAACPACGKPSCYISGLDYFVHDDLTATTACVRKIVGGNAWLYKPLTGLEYNEYGEFEMVVRDAATGKRAPLSLDETTVDVTQDPGDAYW